MRTFLSTAKKKGRKYNKVPPFKFHSTKEIKRFVKTNIAPLVMNSFLSKLKKQNDGVYQNTILIIIVDDEYFFDPALFQEELIDTIEEIKKTQNKFIGIYLLGTREMFIKIK